ncbi:MAG TPA: DUF4350 domain-containing protein [Baekduia sp.]|nr:DUF4350 domain-containing protein [Baekduia sp.]
MTRSTPVAIVAAAAVLVAAALLGRAPEQPSGPPASSYATTPDGLAAYATLLERAGHDVRRIRAALDDRRPAGRETVVVVDGRPLPAAERRALLDYVRAGGHAVLAGRAAALLGDAAVLPRSAAGRAPVTRRVGRGTAVLIGDPEPLRNRALARDDHAAEALAIAGPPLRRVAFVESVHGYHEQRGLAALPDRVQTCLILLGLAALAFLMLCGRRLGPPEQRARALPPPRRAHVEALAAALARAPDRDTLRSGAPTTTTTET